MALVQKSKFEAVDPETGEVTEHAEAAPAANTIAEDAPAAKTTTAERLAKAQAVYAAQQESEVEEVVTTTKAVAVKAEQAVVASTNIAKHNPFKGLENAFPIKFNTLRQIMAVQGNFMDKDSDKPLGDVIGLELISTQKHFILSPGDDSEESKEFVKYSPDGITSDEGENMFELLAAAKAAGYAEASITERQYLVGCLFNAGKLKDMVDAMVQIDLPPTSKAQFDRHQLGTSFAIGKGKKSAEGQEKLRLECIVKNGLMKGSKINWTEVSFSQWKDEA